LFSGGDGKSRRIALIFSAAARLAHILELLEAGVPSPGFDNAIEGRQVDRCA
jgi:hypothetical protein